MKKNGEDREAIPPRQCGNCHWFMPAGGAANAEQGQCKWNPPRVEWFASAVAQEPSNKIAVPQTEAQKRATVQMQMQAYLPPVPADYVCHCHNYKDEPSTDEIIAESIQQIGESVENLAISLDMMKQKFDLLLRLAQMQAPGKG